jgi:hypothetical protein
MDDAEPTPAIHSVNFSAAAAGTPIFCNSAMAFDFAAMPE